MDFFPGFAWPVPRAFAAAVSAGRFEQGDVLYDAPEAYAAWSPGGPRALGCWVQVLDPPRTSRTGPSDADGSRFEANWISPVTVELGGPQAAPAVVVATQGRLFTCLWRGAREWLGQPLAGGDAGEPPLPEGTRELQRRLEQALPALEAALGAAGKGALFASVVDESSEASLAKRRSIEAALARRFEPVAVSLGPLEAGIDGAERFHPALRIHAVGVRDGDPELVSGLLKDALYAPSRGAGDTGGDRFKLERHGLLVAGGAKRRAAG